VLLDFFYHLRARGLAPSTREFLTLLEALRAGVIGPSVEDFYHLARTTLVKDESKFDRFDAAFGEYFNGVAALVDLKSAIPEEWLRRMVEKTLSPEERAKLSALGWEELMETLRKRLEEQQGRHQGGNKWIGTGGTSPFGAYGDNPAGIRIGQDRSRQRSAVKVWDERQFRDYDDTVEFNTRNIKVALRRLRRFAREGAAEELDLPHTLEETGKNAGMLSIQMRPERRNAVKVLLLLDIGGSMDDHVEAVEALFSAAKSEFKRLEHFYFHNCLYDFVWKTNRRRSTERTLTLDLLHKYGPDYRVIFVGDAAMSPYEIEMPGGSVEYMNSESGRTWLTRVVGHFRRVAWLNPMPERTWEYTHSTDLIREIMNGRMYPTTVEGLTRAMRALAK
jgi:uncharacterized protein with von Willebrand factor type A (vWA) domain